jgi:AbrB family looped-hinge helix DNA binding protein
MRATGIIRRVDDLGRIVIPKEVRRTMKIREGEAMEIFTDAGRQMVCFQKVELSKVPLGDELQKVYNRYEAELSVVEKGYFNALIQSVNSEEE